MKKSLLTITALLSILFLAWCNDIMDWDGMERNIEDIPEWGGERISIVTDKCNEEWWEVQTRYEWWEEQEVCFYDDESFCYLEDLWSDLCKKWDMKYYDEEE